MLESWIVFLDGQKTTPLKTGCIPDEIRSAKVKGVYGSGEGDCRERNCKWHCELCLNIILEEKGSQ